MNTEPDCYLCLTAAFVRGRLSGRDDFADRALFAVSLDSLSANEMRELVEIGKEQGLRLHKFKRTAGLPRVQRVLGVLKGLQPASLLDIGSGRGTFLWPLLDTMPWLPVTAVDILDRRVEDILAVQRGGIAQVTAAKADATYLPFPGGHYDIVTALEVLEHIPDAGAAVTEIVRVAQRAVVLSVPSHPDDNPGHIHLFDAPMLIGMLRQAGIERVNVSHVHNHIIVVGTRQS